MDKSSKIFVAGHRGMVGSAIVRRLKRDGFHNLVLRDRSQLDLCDQVAVMNFMREEQPDVVVVAAAKVGGIHANNTYPAQFIYENLLMECNLIHGAHVAGAKRLLFLGSSCIYPKFAAQPIEERELLNGALEPTNEPYAVAKIAGIKLCESYNRQYGADYRSLMPTNLYGPHDNFHPENSHVIPALMRRFHEAKMQGAEEVVVWGTGNALREFLHVDDLAEASVHVLCMDRALYDTVTEPMLSHLNAGTGVDVSIRELATLVAKVVGFQGQLRFDSSKPDGTPRKLLNVERLANLGWRARTPLEQGLAETYQWFLEHVEHIRA